MAARRKHASPRSGQEHNVLVEVGQLASRLHGLVAQLEDVIERMVGPQGLASRAGGETASPAPQPGSAGGDRNGRAAEPRTTTGKKGPNDLPAQTLAHQIQGLIQQIQSAGPAAAGGPLSGTIAQQLRRIIEQAERQQHGANGNAASSQSEDQRSEAAA